jgi:hypothetical protein
VTEMMLSTCDPPPLGCTTTSPVPSGAKLTTWLCGRVMAGPPALRVVPEMRAAEERVVGTASAVVVREPAARRVWVGDAGLSSAPVDIKLGLRGE